MAYRDDLAALTARHATLQAELRHRQRELAGVAALIAEARRLDQAETYFERAPALRRRARRHLAAAALVAIALTGGALGATMADTGWAPVGAPAPALGAARPALAGVDRTGGAAPIRIWSSDPERLAAELEALAVLGLIPVVAPQPPPRLHAARDAGLSAAREHQR
jgi:hypothetical protein